MKIRSERVFQIKAGRERSGPVAYWMSRDQRVQDNWALLFAVEKALELKTPVIVIFCLAKKFLGAGARQFDFMLRGLARVADDLDDFGISFVLLNGDPGKEVPDFVRSAGVSTLVSDFDPLRIKQQWKQSVAQEIDIPFFVVDAHNIVPCRVASQKTEYGAYTIRPKINRLLPTFLDEFPKLPKMKIRWEGESSIIDTEKELEKLLADNSVAPLKNPLPGESAALTLLHSFTKSGLKKYDDLRNDPNAGAQSGLSPYLHFGQISAQRIALEVKAADPKEKYCAAFLEELIVRRELADNFCFYNPGYDSVDGFHAWAKKSLDDHRDDPRDYVYSLKEFERARTHNDLWNAAQRELLTTGRIHGYMRMYWGKKILEWTATPEDAIAIAIHINDKYQLDGRDPNGYTGISWCIGGVHDRAWKERPVYGKIRYMNENGCRRKFDVDQYIERFHE